MKCYQNAIINTTDFIKWTLTELCDANSSDVPTKTYQIPVSRIKSDALNS